MRPDLTAQLGCADANAELATQATSRGRCFACRVPWGLLTSADGVIASGMEHAAQYGAGIGCGWNFCRSFFFLQ